MSLAMQRSWQIMVSHHSRFHKSRSECPAAFDCVVHAKIVEIFSVSQRSVFHPPTHSLSLSFYLYLYLYLSLCLSLSLSLSLPLSLSLSLCSQTAVAEFEAASTGAHVSVEKQAAMARVAIAAKKLRFAAAEALVAAKSDE